MARETDDELIVSKIDELIIALRQNESKNADMFYNISRLFARYCGRKASVLKKTQILMDYASTIQPDNATFMSEIGFQRALLGDY
jgi:hypothetical protein